MARIDLPKRPPWWIRLIFFVARKQYGKTVLPLQMAAHVPGFVVPFMMTNLFAHGCRTLPPDTRLLAMHLVGELNQCNWCIDYARSLAHGTAMQDKMHHVREFATHPAFSPAERAALHYAFESTLIPVAVSDETFAELRRHYSEKQIVELTFAVAIESFFNRVNAPLGVEAEGFCALEPITSFTADLADSAKSV